MQGFGAAGSNDSKGTSKAGYGSYGSENNSSNLFYY